MVQILRETSRTFGEYLILPNLTGPDCTSDGVDLSAALVRHRVGERSPVRIALPLVSAIMEAVSSPRLAIALAGLGGLSFMHHNRSIEDQVADVRAAHGFLVGAGVNTRDFAERIPALVEAGADILCLDSSDGYSTWQREVLQWVRDRYGTTVKVGAGNVVDGRGFRYLAEAGADFVKVGIGGGSICITREQKGIGRGQASALADVVRERDTYARECGEYVPICSDGGVLHDSHMAIALAFGADFLMLGRYFARTDESPSPLVRVNGQLFKEYWGEGSHRARNTDRYAHHDAAAPAENLLFEEGVDGIVPYAGSLCATVSVTLAKIKATLISCGSTTLRQFHDTATLVEVSHQSWLQNSEDVQLRTHPTSTSG